jgi:hypothetical protein
MGKVDNFRNAPDSNGISPFLSFPKPDLNEAALRRTHARVAEPTAEVI